MSNRMRRGNNLGRGLDALIPSAPPVQDESQPAPDEPVGGVSGHFAPPDGVQPDTTPQRTPTGNLMLLPITSIRPNPYQPRTYFDNDVLNELADSIREHGLLQPVVVARIPEAEIAAFAPGEPHPTYQLIAGERRYRASLMIGLTSIPAVIKDANTQQMLELALIENIQRADLNPIEEAKAYKQLIDEFSLTQEQVAKRVGKSRMAVTNAIRLLSLPPEVYAYVNNGTMSEGHARAVLQVKGRANQLRLANQIIKEGINVRKAEDLARQINADADLRFADEHQSEADVLNGVATRGNDLHRLQGLLEAEFNTKVELSRSSKGGKITIHFDTDDQFEGIFAKLTGEE